MLAGLLALVASLVAASTAGAQDAPEPAQSSFTDVAEHWALDHIVGLEGEGIFDGTECGEAMFCPSTPLKRQTMAVWMVRVLDGTDPEPVTGTRFSDVDGSHQWAAHIERFAELGVTKGYTDGTFRPDVTVSRAHMASFLARAFDLPAAEPKGFGDVEGHGHEDNINRIAAVGITVGCGDRTNYCPSRLTSRAEMAVFISRAIKYIESQEAGEPAETEDATPRRRPADPRGRLRPHVHGPRRRHHGLLGTQPPPDRSKCPGGTFKSVAVGPYHSCGIRTDDTVACWGSNDAQSVPPAGSFKAMTVWGRTSCGIRSDGALACWGDNRNNKSGTARRRIQDQHLGEPPCVRDPDRRHRRVLGQQLRSGPQSRLSGSSRPTRRKVQDRRRRRQPHVRDPHQRQGRLLGVQRRRMEPMGWTGAPAGGRLQGPCCRPRSHVRDPHRRHSRLLGDLQVRQARATRRGLQDHRR